MGSVPRRAQFEYQTFAGQERQEETKGQLEEGARRRRRRRRRRWERWWWGKRREETARQVQIAAAGLPSRDNHTGGYRCCCFCNNQTDTRQSTARSMYVFTFVSLLHVPVLLIAC